GDALRNLMDTQHVEALRLGINEGTQPGYFPRQLTDLGNEAVSAGRASKVLDPFNVHQIGREEIFDLPGRTDLINGLSINPQLSGPERLIKSPSGLAEAEYVRGQIPGYSSQELHDLRQLREQTPGLFQPMEQNRALQQGLDLQAQTRLDRLNELSDVE